MVSRTARWTTAAILTALLGCGSSGDDGPEPDPDPIEDPPVTCLGLGADSPEPPPVDGCWLAAGASHTCMRDHEGSLSCWGAHLYGSEVPGPTPQAIEELGTEVLATTAGDNHSCALLRNGGVSCWGANDKGQLGGGTATEVPSLEPVALADPCGPAGALALGFRHTCAAMLDGSVWCWGMNFHGALGDPEITDYFHPAPVRPRSLGGSAVALAAASHTTCALLDDGGVRCWGYNKQGQVGSGSEEEEVLRAERVTLGVGATEIVAGRAHFCALGEDATVWCWGSGTSQQLGQRVGADCMTDSSQADEPCAREPLQVPGLPPIDELASGTFTVCGRSGEDLWCWGPTLLEAEGSVEEPARIELGTPLAPGLAIGTGHICVRSTAGEVYCWGDNQQGQAGLPIGGFCECVQTPTLVPGLTCAP